MDKIMINPSLIFISTDRWEIEDFRDEYLEKMIKIFQEIDKTNDNRLKLIWSYTLEEILWSTPTYKPWSELNGGNTLVPVLYKYFRKNVDFHNHNEISSTSIPDIEINDINIKSEYYKLTNNLIVKKTKFAYLTDIESIKFTSDCGIDYLPFMCKNCFEIFKLNLFQNIFSEEDIEKRKQKLIRAIELYSLENERDLKNKILISNSFIKRLYHLNPEDLNDLINILSLRISYTAAEARACKTIQDEFITSKSINEYRIRVTNRPTSKRVHYVFTDDMIEFKHYYGIGEHDDGL